MDIDASKNFFGNAVDFFKRKDVQWIIVGLVLIAIVFMSASLRFSNWDLLTDSTTGEKMPLALDPHYFLRVGQTILDSENGSMPSSDAFRFSPLRQASWHKEIMPNIVVFIYHAFGGMFNATYNAVNVASPVIFFIVGLILFFILCYILVMKKTFALLATAFLAFIPSYLYRTMAGFSDHESIGMMAFFFALILFALGAKYLTENKKPWIIGLFGVLTGFGTALTVACWGGVANFLMMILPVSFILIWLFNNNKPNKAFMFNGVLFYFLWIIFTLIFGKVFGFPINTVSSFFTSGNGIASLGVFGFIVIDSILSLIKIELIKKKLRILYSAGATIILGIIGLFVVGRNPFGMIGQIIQSLIKPFAEGRFGATVAENAQPFLADWINNMGNILFWLFICGCILFGYVLSRDIKNPKRALSFFVLYSLMIFGIVFSKVSSSHMFNGENLFSYLFYFIPLIVFAIYFVWLYINDNFKFSTQECLIFALIFVTIISGRAAARVFFVITPFVVLIAAYFVVKLFYMWKSSRDDLLKTLFIVGLIVSLILSIVAINQSYLASSYTAERTGPSANAQWQNVMGWIRNNTSEDSVFAHWWDYGYWTQTLGQRASLADGGHFQGAEDGNHKIGRYVLTTPNPETAYSYFKSMESTHLLIDQTDVGKYGAYSKIGSDNNWDRLSYIPTGTFDPSKVQETSNEKIYIYNMQGMVDEDIHYTQNNNDIFLPGPTFDKKIGRVTAKSYLIGVIVEIANSSIKQPTAVYIYNGVQKRIPVRYVYIDGELKDFKSGIDAVIMITPGLMQSAYGTQIDPVGGVVYLSHKVYQSLFAQIYLLNNSFGNYDELILVHSEDDQVVSSLKSQGFAGDFVYYGGLRGPIKIWETGYPEDTAYIKEFPEEVNFDEVGFGSLDRLFE